MPDVKISKINLLQLQQFDCKPENKTKIISIFNEIDALEQDNKKGELTTKDSIQEFLNRSNTILKDEYDLFLQNLMNNSQELKDYEIPLVIKGEYDKSKVSYKGITHFRYDDCPPDKLVSVGNVKVHKDLAVAFKEMQQAAAQNGVNLNIVSGFRSIKDQRDRVFVKKFTDKNNPSPQEFKQRLKWSAPAGYSEHHTGLAIDINSTETSFENTKAFEWLSKNAKKYGFEQSFVKNNKQGVGNEPWHWRFVGVNNEYSAIFKDARKYNEV